MRADRYGVGFAAVCWRTTGVSFCEFGHISKTWRDRSLSKDLAT